MAGNPTTEDDVRRAAARLGLSLEGADLAFYHAVVKGLVGALESIGDLCADPGPSPAGDRAWTIPAPDENPLGAWVVRTDLRTHERGPLAGRTVALKDNVALAGVPMAGGTDFLAGYTPPVDATVVRRILRAGGRILGKAHCEYLSASGGSHTAAAGFVHNPHRHGHMAGGSSSGSAALVGAGEVDLAIGGDQGGSIRIPSSRCGTVGMKPTFGLVPYSGILSIEATIDHTGPITADVADNARLLEVLAGPDGLDPRQGGCRPSRYTAALGRDIRGLRIGLVEEGFREDGAATPRVLEAAERLRALGARVAHVSLPEHATHPVALVAFFAIGATDTLLADGVPSQVAGLGLPGLAAAFHRWRAHPERIPPMAMAWSLTAAAAEPDRAREIYAQAHAVRRALRAAYDARLATFDALLLPTTDGPAPALPEPGAGKDVWFAKSGEGVSNTGAADLTGHPALSVPCGRVDGLPVGAMLVGRHWGETVLYRIAHAFETSFDWREA